MEDSTQQRLALIEDLKVVWLIDVGENWIVSLALFDIDAGCKARVLRLATLGISAHVRVEHSIKGVLVGLR